jgi:hypothetical protein
MDFNNAPEQFGDLIPADTIATLEITIKPDGAGQGGLLTRSKDGGCEMLVLELLVVDGPHARRKLWERWILDGTTKGHADAAEISFGKLRAILESARGIRRNDSSPEAREARNAELGDFDGLRFIGRIGIEKGTKKADGTFWPDKNCLALIVTPDRKDWKRVEQAPPRPSNPTGNGTPPAPVGPVTKPTWA